MKIRFTLFFLWFSILITPPLQASPYALTPDESSRLHEWAQTIPIEEGIGQLFMINIPLHFSKLQDPRAIHKRLIEEEGFGSIILQRSNFDYLLKRTVSGEERLGIVTHFVSTMQYRALASQRLNVPLFIAADFEGPLYNPIKNILTPPPPALTMATTQNKDSIKKTGQVVGYQLASSGINMLLGPVLDIDESSQGTYNSLLNNRSFSSLPEGVSRVAAYYIQGLREAGIAVIGKHFPGLGKVDINPHSGISRFMGSTEDFKRQLIPYYELKDSLNGIMTSHVIIDVLDNKNPVTVSKKMAAIIRGDTPTPTGIRALAYQNKLIMTDDMGMGSILDYETARSSAEGVPIGNGYYSGVDFGALAIDAFDAGHDILLFAKVILETQKSNYSGQYKQGVITVDEIIRVKDRLTRYIQNSDILEARFRAALNRILHAKAAHYKRHGGHVDHFIKGKMKKVMNQRLIPPEMIRSDDGYIDTQKVEAVHQSTLAKSYVLLQGEAPLLTRSNQNNACVFTRYPQYYDALTTKYSHLHLSNSAHRRINLSEDESITDYLARIQQPIEHFIKENQCQYIYFEANTPENMDRLQNIIRLIDSTTKIYIFLHQTPLIIPANISNNKNISIMGAFTRHALSYPLDVQILDGTMMPKEDHPLTVPYPPQKASIILNKPIFDSAFFHTDTPIESPKERADKLFILELQEKHQDLKTDFTYFKEKMESLPFELTSSLNNTFKEQEVTLHRLIPPSAEQVKLYDEILSAEKLTTLNNMTQLLSEINTNIDQRDNLTLVEKIRYKLLSFLSIRQKKPEGAAASQHQNTYSNYTNLLILLITITSLLVLLYIIEFSRHEIAASHSFKEAVLILVKRVLSHPQLYMIMLLLTFVIILLIARIKTISLDDLLARLF